MEWLGDTLDEPGETLNNALRRLLFDETFFGNGTYGDQAGTLQI